MTSTTTFSEHHLHQQHIAQRTACDGDERLMLPLMERDGHADGDGLGDAVAACGKADTLEAVDDEHPEDGGGQHTAQIFHHLRMVKDLLITQLTFPLLRRNYNTLEAGLFV